MNRNIARQREHTRQEYEDPPSPKKNCKTSKSTDEDEPLSPSGLKAKNRNSWIKFCVVMLILEIYLELNPSHNLFWRQPQIGIFSICGNIMIAMLPFYIDNRKDAAKKTPVSAGLWNNIPADLKMVFKSFRRHPTLYLIIVIIFSFIIVSICAEAKVSGKCLVFFRSKIETLIDNTTKDSDHNSDLNTNEPKISPHVAVPETTIKNADGQETVEKYFPFREKLYFSSGDYKITDWDNPDHVKERVTAFIDERKSTNRIDEKITPGYEHITQEINKLDEAEFGKADFIDEINGYEKAKGHSNTATINQLAGNACHAFVLFILEDKTYFDRDDFEYYEYECIQYRFDTIEFIGSNLNWNLHQIHNRYKELADNEFNPVKASALETAFRSICKYKNCAKADNDNSDDAGDGK